jgi:hypothetical protein
MRILAPLVLVTAAAYCATVVKDDRTPLRAGCYADSEVLGTLSQGSPVTIRYALSGESVPCYKVAVELAGKTVEGYLSADKLEGLDEFDSARRDARVLDLEQIMGPAHASAGRLPSLNVQTSDKTASDAAAMIEARQPAKALEMLEPELKKRKSVDVLTLAGVAAWQSDHSRQALEYWQDALNLAPNPELERLYHQVEREANNDRSGDLLLGMRVQLRYEAPAIPGDTARQLLAALDEEFARVSRELGCAPDERVIAIAQSREAYQRTTNAAEWSGGQFDGKIRVPVSESGVDATMRRTLAHEITHACMALLGRWPAWLQEGVAQKLSGETIPPSVAASLTELGRAGQLPKLANLGQDWSRLDAAHAEIAYGLALKAVQIFSEEYAALGLRNLLRNPERLAAITADLDRRLGL